MYYTNNNFIDYCGDKYDYDIATEAFEGIKSKIVTLFSKLVLFIERQVKKMKDSKLKSKLLKLLSRAKKGLAKSKSLNERNPEMVKKLQEEAQDIQEEVNEINEEIKTVKDEVKPELRDGKAMAIYSRIYHHDYTYPFLFSPDLSKNELRILSKEAGNSMDRVDGEFNRVSFRSATGYYVSGVSGTINNIANAFGIEIDKHYSIDEFGRGSLAFMGYISKDEVPISTADISLFLSNTKRVWDVQTMPAGGYKTQFQ